MRLSFIVLSVAALAAGWYVGIRPNETVHPEDVPEVSDVQLRVAEPRTEDSGAVRQVKMFSGLQTTVPDTLGLEERTAARALEAGSFRVRVMYHDVSSSSDEGVVLQQLPRGGVTRRVGWTVTIVVGRLR